MYSMKEACALTGMTYENLKILLQGGTGTQREAGQPQLSCLR